MPHPRNPSAEASPPVSLPRIRPAMAADLAAITAIQAERLRQGAVTSFAVEPLALREVTALRERLLTQGYPWLVAEDGEGAVLGFAFAAPFVGRGGAWRRTVEGTVCVRAGGTGRGAGRALLAGLLAACATKGFRQMVAMLTEDAEGKAAIELHQALGFRRTGALRGIGLRDDEPVDAVLLQRALGEAAPDAAAA